MLSEEEVKMYRPRDIKGRREHDWFYLFLLLLVLALAVGGLRALID